jgi:hypothetical protein
VVATLDVLAKITLLMCLALVVIDPSWGNLAGKAPTARAVIYPLMACVVPLWWALRRPASPYPWLADLLLTYVGFSDILGNRLDLYDRVAWFDDLIHVVNTACVAAALVLVTMHQVAPFLPVLERAVALGLTAAVGWEVFEYLSFVAHSGELPTAYGDTVGDLVMGWLGTVAAALLVHFSWRSHLPVPRSGASVGDGTAARGAGISRVGSP